MTDLIRNSNVRTGAKHQQMSHDGENRLTSSNGEHQLAPKDDWHWPTSNNDKTINDRTRFRTECYDHRQLKKLVKYNSTSTDEPLSFTGLST